MQIQIYHQWWQILDNHLAIIAAIWTQSLPSLWLSQSAQSCLLLSLTILFLVLTISVVVWWNVGVSPSSLPTSPLPSPPPLPSPATTERSALPVMVMRKVAYSAWLFMANPQLSRFLLINYFFFLIWVLFCFSFSLSKFGVKMWGRVAGLLYCWYGVFRCMMIGVGIHWCCSH